MAQDQFLERRRRAPVRSWVRRLSVCRLDVGFQEVVHLVRTEEAEVAKLQCSTERPDEHPQECSPDAKRSRGHGAVCGSRRQQGRRRAPVQHRSRRPSPNGSNGSAQVVSMACATAPPGLFHCQAKQRQPRAPPSRRCAGSATPASRSPQRLGVSPATVSRILRRLGLNRMLGPGAGRTGAPLRARTSRRDDPHRHQEARPIRRIGHRITGDRTGQSKAAASAGSSSTSASTTPRGSPSAEIQPDERKAKRRRLPQGRRRLLSKPRRHRRARHDRQRLLLSKPSPSRDACTRARPQAHPHQALHAQDQRQGRALHPDRAPRVGLRPGPTTPQTNEPPSCRSGSTDTTGIDLTAVSNPKRPSADSADRGQPVEAPHLVTHAGGLGLAGLRTEARRPCP